MINKAIKSFNIEITKIFSLFPPYKKLQYLESAVKLINKNINNTESKISSIEKEILKHSDDLAVIKNDFKFNQEFLPKTIEQYENVNGNMMHISKNQKKSKSYTYKLQTTEFLEKLKDFIIKTDVVLDIGSGIRPQTFFRPNVHICIEPFKQYRDIIKPYFPNYCHFVFIKEDALKSIRLFDDESVDTIMIIDVIEHLDKDKGLQLIKEADRVARKQILIFTPLGFYPMHFKNKGQKDAWGLDGNNVQEHKSGWDFNDFDHTWNFHICKNGVDAFFQEEREKGIKYSTFMAIKTKTFKGYAKSKKTPSFVKEVYNQQITKI